MKKLLFIAASCCLLSSCFFNSIRGSGKMATENRQITGFTGISSSTSVNVEVTQSTDYSVTVIADDNIIQHVKTQVVNNQLKIFLGDNISISNGTYTVKVTAPQVNSLRASSSSSIKSQGIIKSSEKITVDASSAADISVEVDAPDVDAEATSSATVALSGRTKNFDAKANSGADIKAFELLSENTKAHASSSGSTNVFASITLNASASSSGNVRYKGSATVTKSESSSGTVEKE